MSLAILKMPTCGSRWAPWVSKMRSATFPLPLRMRACSAALQATFKVDDNLVYNGNGTLLTTDNTGEFVINVSPGSHSIRVVKKNHSLADDGMLIDLDAADGNTMRHNFQKDLTGYYFWDETKIKVNGRIAGGINEGSKPMGEWKTKNIIGSNMQIVLQLDGDSSSYIYIVTTPTPVSRRR